MNTPLFTSNDMIPKRLCRLGLEGESSGTQSTMRADQESHHSEQEEQVGVETREQAEQAEQREAEQPAERAEKLAEKALENHRKTEGKILRLTTLPYHQETAERIQLAYLKTGDPIAEFEPLKPPTAELKAKTTAAVEQILSSKIS